MKGVEKGRSSLVKEKENMIYILTKMKRDNRDRRNIFNDKLVRINEKKNHWSKQCYNKITEINKKRNVRTNIT